MSFIALGTSTSGRNRVNTCMRTRHKYINNCTAKQTDASSVRTEVGRMQARGWRQGRGNANFMEKPAEFYR